MHDVHDIRDKPINSGKPVQLAIVQAIERCAADSFVQAMLGRSISNNVYKQNSCTTTKNYALQALERELIRHGLVAKRT